MIVVSAMGDHGIPPALYLCCCSVQVATGGKVTGGGKLTRSNRAGLFRSPFGNWFFSGQEPTVKRHLVHIFWCPNKITKHPGDSYNYSEIYCPEIYLCTSIGPLRIQTKEEIFTVDFGVAVGRDAISA